MTFVLLLGFLLFPASLRNAEAQLGCGATSKVGKQG